MLKKPKPCFSLALRIPLCVMPRRLALPDSSQLYFHGFLSVPQGRLVAPLGLSSLPETFHTRRLVTACSLAPLSSPLLLYSSLISSALHGFLTIYGLCSVKCSKADTVCDDELGIFSGIVSPEEAGSILEFLFSSSAAGAADRLQLRDGFFFSSKYFLI